MLELGKTSVSFHSTVVYLHAFMLFICLVLELLLSFTEETGEHKDYLGLHFTVRPFGNALATQCPNLTVALNVSLVTQSSGPF